MARISTDEHFAELMKNREVARGYGRRMAEHFLQEGAKGKLKYSEFASELADLITDQCECGMYNPRIDVCARCEKLRRMISDVAELEALLETWSFVREDIREFAYSMECAAPKDLSIQEYMLIEPKIVFAALETRFQTIKEKLAAEKPDWSKVIDWCEHLGNWCMILSNVAGGWLADELVEAHLASEQELIPAEEVFKKYGV